MAGWFKALCLTGLPPALVVTDFQQSMRDGISVVSNQSLQAPVVQWMFNGCLGVMFNGRVKICFNV